MRLFCPDCGAAIGAGDIDLDKLLAKCRACNSDFGFKQSISAEQARGENRLPPGAVMSIPARPPRMHAADTVAGWEIRWRWFNGGFVMLLFFCIAWDSFLIFWYSMALRPGSPWIAVIFPVCHVAIGVGLTYLVLAGFINSTAITLAGGQISVRHGPLFWPGNRTLAIGDIAQFFCDENGPNPNQNQPRPRTFNLSAVLKDGSRVKLCRGFNTPEEPKYLEYELEHRLRLPPHAVAGELKY